MGGGRLSGAELREREARFSGWRVREDQRIAKTFLFPDFQTALDFVNRAGEVAEFQGHHPDLHLAWGRVDVEIRMHEAGGLTDRDFKLAEGIDQAYFKR